MFTYAPGTKISGSHLIAHLDDAIGDKIAARFEAAEDRRESNPAYGCYGSRKEYQFLDGDGRLYNVYSVWLSWRLGGYDLTPGDVSTFIDWVKSL